MDYELLFPGRFIKSIEFKGRPVTITIKNVYREKLPEKNGREKVKGIVELVETDKEWVINRTNAECIKAMFGRDTSGWHGKRVTLYPAAYEGKTAIRVKGSPDIENDFEVVVDLGFRHRPFTMLMEKTPEPRKRAAGKTKAPRANAKRQKEQPALQPHQRRPRVADDGFERVSEDVPLEGYYPPDPRQ